MSKEDDAIIQAVADEITNNLGPDTWEGSGLEGYSAAGRAEMMDVAKAAIAAYLGSLEAMGRVVTVKEPDASMLKAAYDLETKCAAYSYGSTPSSDEVWEAMLGASPKPPGLGD